MISLPLLSNPRPEAEAPEGWPFRPHSIVSLLDMLYFHASSFVSIFKNLEWLKSAIQGAQDQEGGMKLFRDGLDFLKMHFRELKLSHLERYAQRIIERIDQKEPIQIVIARIDDLTKEVDTCLKEMQFYAIPEEEVPLLFGNIASDSKLPDSFPKAIADIQNANRCFCFEQYTASVFHSMRALERGLVSLAKVFGVSTDTQNWYNLINNVEKEIGDREKGKKPLDVSKEDLQFYSQVATEFSHFRSAWRNHVNHAYDSYDKRRADPILRHTQDFMERISEKLRE